MEPFSRSCKSLEVIPSPRGVVSQARINPSTGWFPLKQRRHLELFCGYSGRTRRAGKSCFSLHSILSPSLRSPGLDSDIPMDVEFPQLTPWNFSIQHLSGTATRGTKILGEPLDPVRKSSSVKWKEKQKKRKKREEKKEGRRGKKLLGMMKF